MIFEDNKIEYSLFAAENFDKIPIFYQAGWLNAVSKTWLGFVYKNSKGNIEAIMPLPYKKVLNNIFITMPKQTPFLGIWFNLNKDIPHHKRYAIEQQIIIYFLNKIPKFAFYKIRFPYEFINHQPFHWNGFRQTNQYSYILSDIKNHDLVFNSFKGSLRTDIRKAEKLLDIIETDDLAAFYKINSLSFQRQKLKIKYSFELAHNIDEYLVSINKRKILLAIDRNGNVHAGLYLIWDSFRAYYLWGGADQKFRNSNAQSLLLWEAIKISSKYVDNFDFEGSMIQNVAEVFKKYNPVAMPYSRIYKVNNIIMKLREYL